MSWTEKYWDVVNHFYWWPQFIGLKSIPQKCWSINGESVSIPREMVNPNGPLYRRFRSGQNFTDYVRRQEETFNHIFSLTLAIVPGDVIGELLGAFTKAGRGHHYESFGRELSDRHGWPENDNITSPDGFFVSEGSILAVELKFTAKTSLDQLAKYAVLMEAEERLTSQSKILDLLYVFNRDPVAAFRKQAGFGPEAVGGHLLDDLNGAVKNETVRRLLVDHESNVRSVLDRIRITCISWQDLFDVLLSFSNSLGNGFGERTLRRLLDGLMLEIERHPLSRVKRLAADGVA